MALVALLSGLVVRCVRLAVNEPLWGDEAMLVRSLLDRSYAELLEPLDYTQLAPLGFLWMQATCREWFGTADWVWRLVPFLASCGSLIAFAKFAERVLPRHAAWLATAIMASSLYLIRHSVEAKPYITDLAWALAVAMLGGRIHQQPRDVTRWTAFGIVTATGVWCSFPCALAAGGVLLSLIPTLSAHRKESFRPTASFIACGFAVAANFLAMYLIFGQQQVATARDAGYWQTSMWEVAYPPWQRPSLFAWWLLREHAGAMMAHPFGGKNFASLGTLLLVIIGIRVLANRDSRLLSLLLMPAGMGLFAACLQKYPYGGTARTMLYLAPAICLLGGIGGWAAIVRWLPSSRRRLAFNIAISACLALIAGRLSLQIACPFKEHGDRLVRETIRHWAAESGPDDVWIIGNAVVPPEFDDRGIYGGLSVAVFDHYAITLGPEQTLHPRELGEFPVTSGIVSVLVHESRLRPLPCDVAVTVLERYENAADLLGEDEVDLGRGETLRRLIFVAQDKAKTVSRKGAKTPSPQRGKREESIAMESRVGT